MSMYLDKYKIPGRTACVTGGGRGIGLACAEALAEAGAKVVIADRDGAIAKEGCDQLRAKGYDPELVILDVTDSARVNAVADTIVARHGKIDILVNNAGTGTTGLIIDHSVEDWEQSMRVNLKGTFLCSRAVAKEMIPRKQGRIVNIASIGGKEGEEFIGGYCASKFGVIGLTQVMAKELGRHRITVNAVCPGYIWTPMWEKMAIWFKQNFPALAKKSPREIFEARVRSVTPLRRPQSAEDIASLVAFLVSGEARNINGQSINVDGGARMH